MYERNFVKKANLQSVVNFLLSDRLAVIEAEAGSPEERYQRYATGISKGLKAFHKAELSSLDWDEYGCGDAADPIWENIWDLEKLHFEMGFRTGAAFVRIGLILK